MSTDRGQLPTWFRRRDQLAREIGKLSGRRLSNRTLRRIQFVLQNGAPILIEAMDAERISIAAAAELADLPASWQKACLNDVRLRRDVLRVIRDLPISQPDQRLARLAQIAT